MVAGEFDVFISHASEDKDAIVRALAHALDENYDLRVWYDEFELRIGDSLRRKVDAGISRSRFGVVVLSHAFFCDNHAAAPRTGAATHLGDTVNTTLSIATPAQLLADIEGRYASYAEFEQVLVATFNARAFDFPTGYGWRDVLRWGMGHGLVARDGQAIVLGPT